MPKPQTGKKLTASIDTTAGGKSVPTRQAVAAWSVAGNLVRLVSLVVLAGLGVEFAHFYSMQSAQSYTADQWDSAVQTRGDLAEAAWVFMLLSIGLLSQKNVKARQLLATLPLVPTVRSSRNPTAEPVPMTWPPVPEGSPSPLRRISARLVVACPVAWGLCWIAAIQYDGNVEPSTAKYIVLVTFCVLAVLGGLLAIVFDMLRLRGWARWPSQAGAAKLAAAQAEPVA